MDHDPKSEKCHFISIDSVKPSPENDRIYHPANPKDPAIIKLARSILNQGVLTPIIYTADGFIESGHRRHCAARLAGLTEIPAIMSDIRREDDIEAFTARLAEHNIQRKKTFDEEVREEIARQNPETAYQSLIEEREKTNDILEPFKILGQKTRSRITRAKRLFLDAVQKVIHERREHLPLSVRQIHYALLNDPPLKHASKPNSVYKNDASSYKNLIDLTTRARLDGSISMEAIADSTRPVSCWQTYNGPQDFVADQLDRLLCGYWRDLMQSQPDHIEILAEKNTIQSIVNRVAERYCIPTVTGRGYCSVSPREGMRQRYLRSGKNRLVVLIVSDFDPDGEEIAQSFARSMRDEFDVENIHPIKVALTADHVEQFDLVPSPDMKAKRGSSQYEKFVSKYGDDVFEVEALQPSQLIDVLTDAIDNVIDTDLFNRELAQEKEDASKIMALRKVVQSTIADRNFLAC
ncbi:ParB N-terminal domain-containing protein [Gimesia sp.]|uniref:ParB/RepB/Spo0J family partition protein n=1 Tax=Gimesia sp. TaxID=2024833 RepID=UPI000EE2010B|nr:ParB N-terminal domain-containing protein [Gimesia sp.]HAH46702.1 chromosome partitioning protein ParB [Planctomycetaceae bacterium]